MAWIAAIGVLTPMSVSAQEWPLLNQAELALTKPVIDPSADAEVMLWE
jgi:hypothetical protein